MKQKYKDSHWEKVRKGILEEQERFGVLSSFKFENCYCDKCGMKHSIRIPGLSSLEQLKLVSKNFSEDVQRIFYGRSP